MLTRPTASAVAVPSEMMVFALSIVAVRT